MRALSVFLYDMFRSKEPANSDFLSPHPMRQLAIGDIHGCLTALQVLDQELAFGDGDTVVTLGDYVDRGPDSRGVIDFLLDIRKRCRLVALRGNHEIMMMRARDDRSSLLNWIACGGDTTLDSYGAAGFQDVPEFHWEFMADTIRYHIAEHDFFVHAIKVETSVARRPPRRTRRAELPHRAPRKCAQVELRT